MDKVHILVEGYAYSSAEGKYVATPTSLLIVTNSKKILVDPGAHPQKLLEALKKLRVFPQNIDAIYLSHYHPDHFLNIRLFPKVDIYDGTTFWQNDEEHFHEKFIPGTDIEILPTPGHSAEHTSLLVKTDEGVVCIAADVFWWEDGQQRSDAQEELLQFSDPYATDTEALLASRKLVLQRAEWIIPGHGKKFRNPTLPL